MGLDAPREVGAERSTYMPTPYDEEDILRDRFAVASEIALCYLYDEWKIHDYEKFLESQTVENSTEEIAPNGIRFSRDDLSGLESKGYSRDEAIAEMETWDKYTIVIDWEHYPPNELEMVGQEMHPTRFLNDQFKFVFERTPEAKRIKTLLYDQIMVHVYRKDWPSDDTDEYVYVAKVAYYYYSASRYVMRYCNLFDEDGKENIDQTHIDEYLLDKNKKDAA